MKSRLVVHQQGWRRVGVSRSVLGVIVGAMLIGILATQEAYADAAGRAGRSGAIAGRDCTGCHTAGAAVPTVVFGGNQTVAAGATGTFTFTISGGPAVVAGVDVSASGGTLGVAPGTTGTKILSTEFVQSTATPFAGGSAVYTFTWTAPATAAAGTTFTLYGAGLSGNGNARDGAGDGTATASYPITIMGAANNGGGTTPVTLTANPGGPYTGVTNQTVQFDASATTTPAGTTIPANGYMWDFGDGTTGSGISPTHVYTAAGSYNVTLQVFNSAGATNTATTTVTVTDTVVGTPGGPAAAVGLPRIGERLYNQFCSECHGPSGLGIVGDGPDVTGSSTAQIEDAIANVVDMQTPELQALEEDEVKLISSFLRGARLYIDNCESCHGVSGGGGDAPAILGASASAIASAIENVLEMQTPELQALTKRDRKLIAFFIPADPAATTSRLRSRGILGDVPADYDDILSESDVSSSRTANKNGALDWFALSALGIWAVRRRRKH